MSLHDPGQSQRRQNTAQSRHSWTDKCICWGTPRWRPWSPWSRHLSVPAAAACHPSKTNLLTCKRDTSPHPLASCGSCKHGNVESPGHRCFLSRFTWVTFIYSWLVVHLPLWKYESQLGWFFPIYGKIKKMVPNHQPDSHVWLGKGKFWSTVEQLWKIEVYTLRFVLQSHLRIMLWMEEIPVDRW